MLTWLAKVAREAGLEVDEVEGWTMRGRDTMRPRGIVCHHTAGGRTGDIPSLRTLVHGRSDLPGPLCHYGLGRSGTVYVVAAGKANHAGTGEWRGLRTNSEVIGIEAENAGDAADPWPDRQLDAYVRLCAAVCEHLGVEATMVAGHKEWAQPAGRKPDPHSIDMDDFRVRVAQVRVELRGTGGLEASIASMPQAEILSPGQLEDLPELGRGDKDGRVGLVQALLAAHGLPPAGTFHADHTPDFDFGVETETALRIFQASSGIVATGRCNLITWSKLLQL